VTQGAELANRLLAARAFVFDFYGTLAGDAVSVPPMWQVLADLGYASHPELEAVFEPDGFDGTVTSSLDHGHGHDRWIESNWRSFVRLSGVPPADVEAVLAHLLRVRGAYRAQALPGVHDLLRLLRSRGIRIGVCSNWENDITPYLAQAGLVGIDAVATSVGVGARKPHPMIFAAVCDQLGIDPADGVFVGDNWHADIVGALRYGLTPVWIRGSRPSRALHSHVLEFDTVAELGATFVAAGAQFAAGT
jgi:putative hydrolase of the HAD superfamily